MNLLFVLILIGGRTAQATRIVTSPVIDGVLDEECWDNPGITDFVEAYPMLGEDVSESTRIVFCYDDDDPNMTFAV